MASALNSVASKTAQNYAGISGNKEAALDPATITAFVQLITEVIGMLKACKSTPKAAADTAKSPGLFARMRLRSAVKNSMSPNDFRDHGPHVINAILQSGKDATPEAMTSLYNEVQ